MLDTKGPEIRTGMLRDNKPIDLVAGQELTIVTDYTYEGDTKKIACSYKDLPTSVKVGSVIFIADGSLTCEVTEILDGGVKVIVKNDVKLGERKNMNLPGCDVNLPTLTEQDIDDICDFGLKKGVDLIAASFVRCAEDIETIRDELGPRGAYIKIIAKIENHQGLHNYDEILQATDGIMVARGDLGMEIPPEKVFIAQKWMIEKANIVGKPVVCATQMLESMIKAPRPTRAEASDVANAVIDGADCVMLSGETAGGQYPTQAVGIMARICVEAEAMIDYRKLYNDLRHYTPQPLSTPESVAAAAVSTILDLQVDLAIVLTDTGKIARLVAKYRPKVPILACSVSAPVVRQLNTSRGVHGYKIPSFQGTDNLLQLVIKTAKDMGLCKAGNKVVTIHGQDEEKPEESSIIKILEIE